MDTEQLLQEGIAAARAGQRTAARQALVQVIKADQRNEQAWLWLAAVIENPSQQRHCLAQVLALNPHNTRARQGIAWLDKHHAPATGPAPRPPAESSPAPAPPSSSTPPATPEQRQREPAQEPQREPVQEQSTPPPSASSAAKGIRPSSSASRLASLRTTPPPAQPDAQPQGAKPETAGIKGDEHERIAARTRDNAGAKPDASAKPAETTEAVPDLTLCCPYCGAETSLAQRACPACRKSLMERTSISPTRSAALSFVGGMWGAGSMLTIAIGFVSLERGTGFFLLLVAGVLSLGVAVGLLQRHRWAYLATLVALVPLAILAWKLMFWPILLPLALALLRSYSDFHQPLQRMLPRLAEGNHEEHHLAGTYYRQQEMWYLAAQEWQAALRQQPHNETYRRNLGYAYLALRQPEQAYAEFQTILMSQPDDPTIQQVLQNLEQALSQKQGSRTR